MAIIVPLAVHIMIGPWARGGCATPASGGYRANLATVSLQRPCPVLSRVPLHVWRAFKPSLSFSSSSHFGAIGVYLWRHLRLADIRRF